MKAFGMRVLAASVALAAVGCSQAAQTVTLQSLSASGAASFVCVSDGAQRQPRDLAECPDTSETDGENRHLYSLVTQSTRGEVAVVDLSAGTVVDQDPSFPGYNFVTVGDSPIDIVSTPGSVASFVGVAEPGKEGIFALPTTCMSERTNKQRVRDITTWPACRLRTAPGKMAILIDPAIDTNGDGVPDVVRESCGSRDLIPIAPDPKQANAECPADLSLEMNPPEAHQSPAGRRKLVVALPQEGQLAIIDAQTILDMKPGQYQPCPVESYVPLGTTPPTPVLQRLPADFVVTGGPNAGDACTSVSRPTGLVNAPAAFSMPTPAGFAQIDETGDHRLFVADAGAPVIHVFDTSDPCNITSAPPLLPESYVDPTRAVTTSRVAVSPLTTAGKRYLYAIDEQDVSGASVMIFDVSPGSADRTPILRPRSPLLPFEPPDRIAFDVPAQDVTFAQRIPGGAPDPTTGTEAFVRCNPDPNVPVTDSSAFYRPSSEFTVGARPAQLRGTFGFVALTSGDVAVIDVDDLDTDCRRPISTNDGPTEDFRGCANDNPAWTFNGNHFLTSDGTVNGTPTVTNEVTCRAVEANRTRASNLVIDDPNIGIRAPALSAFPKLLSDDGRTLPTDNSAQGKQNPRMLAVNFSATEPAQVWVSSTLFQSGTGTDLENSFAVEPQNAKTNSLVLNFREPRAYSANESFHAVFEGPILSGRSSGILTVNGSTATLTDVGIVFCDRGVDDRATAADRGVGQFGVAPADAALFGEQHADYVSITSDLLLETDPYWVTPDGARCAGANSNQTHASFIACQQEFGPALAKNKARDFRIIAATAQSLTIESRNGTPTLLADAACCFPEAVAYEVRASKEWVVSGTVSGFQHDIATNADGTCGRDKCNPLKANLRSRVIEVSCDPSKSTCLGLNDPSQQVIGFANTDPTSPDRDVACVIADPENDLTTLTPQSNGCIYQGISGSFVIYRGISTDPVGSTEKPRETGVTTSATDFEFDWDVLGGFSPLFINLSSTGDTNTNPRAIQPTPYPGSLVVVDGASKGIVLVDLGTFAIAPYF